MIHINIGINGLLYIYVLLGGHRSWTLVNNLSKVIIVKPRSIWTIVETHKKKNTLLLDHLNILLQIKKKLSTASNKK